MHHKSSEPVVRRNAGLGWKVVTLFLQHPWPVLTTLVVLILAASGLDIVVPLVTRGVIDTIVKSLNGSHMALWSAVWRAGFLIFGATAVARLLRSFYNYRLFHASSQIEDRVKNAAFANFLRLDTAYHGNVNTGEIVGALDRGGTATFVILYEILGQNLVPPLVVLVGVLTTLVMKNPWIALIVFLPLPAYVAAISRLSQRMQENEHKVSRGFEEVTKESYDIASNVSVVKKFSREDEEAARQRKLLHIARGHQYRGERIWALIENAQTFIATAGRVGVIVAGGYFVLTHRCTVGDYVLFIAMQDMVYGPISQLSIILPKLRRNLWRAERLFEILDEKPSVCDAPDARPLEAPAASVEFRNVSFRYPGRDEWALENVDFTVPAGSKVALIGRSGSGKTTLMKLLQRLYDPQEGSILIDGTDIRSVTQQSLREQIAVVPQEVDLFSRTLFENISYGRDGVAPEEVEEAASLAHADAFIERCPAGYNTQAGERGVRLSGGERQRLGIARAMLRDPKILILDEATSHLDNESERMIQLAMDTVTRGRTCFIVAHRLSTVRNADLVAVFANNGIEAIGTPEELWRTSPTYRKLHGVRVTEMPRRTRHDFDEEGQPVLLPAVGE